ncbi:MAG TPA: MTAP family purine nucleoside phosphorylase [Microthrixaceae bacterium]|nr:MTAP family purine nucleoside phosphorylase [Microthrixaceae bacterium]
MLELPPSEAVADLGILGGSGFYEFLGEAEPASIETPYGPPSEVPLIGRLGPHRVAFIARHGTDHRIPAHRVNYRANLWALATLGASAVISPFACGSLRRELGVGHLVVVDQQVDRTNGRNGTFFDGPVTWHQPLADPYDIELGGVIATVARSRGLEVHLGGTVVVIGGPRFSTRAESRWHREMGWDLVNMTQAPEAALAAEAGMRFVGLGLVTDYDTGLDDDSSVTPVTQDEIFAVLRSNADQVRGVLSDAIPRLDLD